VLLIWSFKAGPLRDVDPDRIHMIAQHETIVYVLLFLLWFVATLVLFALPWFWVRRHLRRANPRCKWASSCLEFLAYSPILQEIIPDRQWNYLPSAGKFWLRFKNRDQSDDYIARFVNANLSAGNTARFVDKHDRVDLREQLQRARHPDVKL